MEAVPPQMSDDERDLLVSYILSLRKDFVQTLLERLQLPKSGIKADLRQRLHDALQDDPARIATVIAFLDEREPWGKQQVEMLTAPPHLAQGWADPVAALQAALSDANADGMLEQLQPLALPEELALVSVTTDDDKLEVRAVERREYFERDPSKDFERTEDGILVRYRASSRRVARGTFVLRFRPSDRSAALHISQGDRSYDYGDARNRFTQLIEPWLDLDQFGVVDLRPAVAKLHRLEADARNGGPPAPTRAHRLAIRLDSGTLVALTSPASDSPMVGESVVDDTVTRANKAGTGAVGNVYFTPGNGAPLDDEIHVIVAAADSQILIRNPSKEESVVHVVDTIRGLC